MTALILSIMIPSKLDRFLKPFSGLDNQIAYFSKYISKSRTKRLPLTTKRAGKGYYKGNGSRKEGVISSKGSIIECCDCNHLSDFNFSLSLGRFRLIREMCTEIVTPDLRDFKLKAYVAPGAKRHITEMKVSSA